MACVTNVNRAGLNRAQLDKDYRKNNRDKVNTWKKMNANESLKTPMKSLSKDESKKTWLVA